MSLTLYHASPSRSSMILWLLEELGCDYDLAPIDFDKGGHRTESFLALNPMGKVPTLTHDHPSGQQVTLTESTAIALYLADSFPQAGLAPAPDHADRAAYLRWMVFCTSALEPMILDQMSGHIPENIGACPYGDKDRCLGALVNALDGQDYLTGDAFTAADVMIAATLGWARMTRAIALPDALNSYLKRCISRPAWKAAQGKENPV
ncbi:MAG: glutathione S-transferase [Alphaproteobacteria bacterium]